jgi:hypothetical protein
VPAPVAGEPHVATGTPAASTIGSIGPLGHDAIRQACTLVQMATKDCSGRAEAGVQAPGSAVGAPWPVAPTPGRLVSVPEEGTAPLPPNPPPGWVPRQDVAVGSAPRGVDRGCGASGPDDPVAGMAACGPATPAPQFGAWSNYTGADGGSQQPRGKWGSYHSNSQNPAWIDGPFVVVAGYKLIIRNAWFDGKGPVLSRMRNAGLAMPCDVAISNPCDSGTQQIFITYKKMIDAQLAMATMTDWWCDYPEHVGGPKERGRLTGMWADPARYR